VAAAAGPGSFTNPTGSVGTGAFAGFNNSFTGPTTAAFAVSPSTSGAGTGPQSQVSSLGQFSTGTDLALAADQITIRRAAAGTTSGAALPGFIPLGDLAQGVVPRDTLLPTGDLSPLIGQNPLLGMNPVQNLLRRGTPLAGAMNFSPLAILSTQSARTNGGGSNATAPAGAFGYESGADWFGWQGLDTQGQRSPASNTPADGRPANWEQSGQEKSPASEDQRNANPDRPEQDTAPDSRDFTPGDRKEQAPADKVPLP